jgi:ribosome-associated translation inhibitor RaiA
VNLCNERYNNRRDLISTEHLRQRVNRRLFKLSKWCDKPDALRSLKCCEFQMEVSSRATINASMLANAEIQRAERRQQLPLTTAKRNGQESKIPEASKVEAEEKGLAIEKYILQRKRAEEVASKLFANHTASISIIRGIKEKLSLMQSATPADTIIQVN